eukprot:1578018-Rhodomonas_salina.4
MAMGAAGGGLRSLPDVPLDFGDGGKVARHRECTARGTEAAAGVHRVVLGRRRVCNARGTETASGVQISGADGKKDPYIFHAPENIQITPRKGGLLARKPHLKRAAERVASARVLWSCTGSMRCPVLT